MDGSTMSGSSRSSRSSGSSSNSRSSDDDYVEEPYVDNSLDMICLFCDQKETVADSLLDHIHSKHNLDLKELCSSNKFDSLMYIKLVNYIRSHKTAADEISTVLKDDEWKTEKYLRPVIQNDVLLTLDFVSSDEENDDEIADSRSKISDEIDITAAKARIKSLEEELNRVKSLLRQFNGDEEKSLRKREGRSSNDDFFFWSYAHHDIHHEMLSDKVRTEAYKEAIFKNKSLIQGKLCLDVGCGTGILSLFATSAGASKVIAVDQSDIIYSAMDISEENGVSRKIDFRKVVVESLNLDTKVDVIISEWMGYFLLFEGMLDTIIYARNKYLKPEGLIFPGKCSLFLAALSDKEFYDYRVGFWDDVYGFRMSSMKKEILEEVQIGTVNSKNIVSSTVELKKFDLYTCSLKEAQKVDSKFVLEIAKSGKIHALVVWFDCYFDLPSLVTLSTSPYSEETHWKQSILFLEEPLEVLEGDKIRGRIAVSRTDDNFRSLRIKLLLEGRKVQKYVLL